MGSLELDVYQLNDEAVAYFNNAEKTVMLHQPNYDSSGGGQFSRWKRSPLDTADVWALESATMTSWVNMEEDDRKWMERIRALGHEEGCLYVQRWGQGLYFLLISPSERIIVLVRHYS